MYRAILTNNAHLKRFSDVADHSGVSASRTRFAVRCRLLQVEAEAGCIVAAWPRCPLFASRRVDHLTLTHDRLLGVEVGA